MAVLRRISLRISEGTVAMGQGGGGEPSVGGGAVGTAERENEAIKSRMEGSVGPYGE